MSYGESDLWRALAGALRERGAQCLKIHGSMFSKGLPDTVLWRPGSLVLLAELKIAADLHDAVASLSPAQASVIAAVAKSKAGVLLAWTEKSRSGGGFAHFMNSVDRKLPAAPSSSLVLEPQQNRAAAVGLLADGIDALLQNL